MKFQNFADAVSDEQIESASAILDDAKKFAIENQLVMPAGWKVFEDRLNNLKNK